MSEYLAGVATTLLVLAILNRRTVWWHVKEEWRYRRDGIYVWWVLRQERKTVAEETP
jgi:hypothetical protein